MLELLYFDNHDSRARARTVAGLGRFPDDPVFQAMAALERLTIHAEEPVAAHTVAEGAIFDARGAARKEYVVTLDGEEMRTHEQIDAHFTPAFGPEDEEQFNRFVERIRPAPSVCHRTGRT